MKILLIGVLMILCQTTVNAQFMSVGLTLSEVINSNEGTKISTAIKGQDIGKRDTAVLITTQDDRIEMWLYYFKGISLDSKCCSVLITAEISLLSSIIKMLNSQCVIISPYKWMKYSGQDIYDAELKVTKDIGSITVKLRE